MIRRLWWIIFLPFVLCCHQLTNKTIEDKEDTLLVAYFADASAMETELIVQKGQKILRRIPIASNAHIQWLNRPHLIIAIRYGDFSIIDIETGSTKKLFSLTDIKGADAESPGEGVAWDVVDGKTLVIAYYKAHQIWSVNLVNYKTTLVLDSHEFRKYFRQRSGELAYGYLSDIRVSEDMQKIAISVKGSNLRYSNPIDYESDCYILDLKSKQCLSVGKGMPIDWIDDNRLAIWDIDNKQHRDGFFITRIVNKEGKTIDLYRGFENVSWTGKSLIGIKTNEFLGQLRKNAKLVSLGDEEKKNSVKIVLAEPFTSAYSQNFLSSEMK